MGGSGTKVNNEVQIQTSNLERIMHLFPCEQCSYVQNKLTHSFPVFRFPWFICSRALCLSVLQGRQRILQDLHPVPDPCREPRVHDPALACLDFLSACLFGVSFTFGVSFRSFPRIVRGLQKNLALKVVFLAFYSRNQALMVRDEGSMANQAKSSNSKRVLGWGRNFFFKEFFLSDSVRPPNLRMKSNTTKNQTPSRQKSWWVWCFGEPRYQKQPATKWAFPC